MIDMSAMSLEEIEANARKAVNLLKALSNEKRLMIVCSISGGEKSVGELENIVGLSQSALSQHLARLRRDNLVTTRREAQTIYYSLNNPQAQVLLECLCSMYAPRSGGAEGEKHENSPERSDL